jgi:hypothetical protein
MKPSALAALVHSCAALPTRTPRSCWPTIPTSTIAATEPSACARAGASVPMDSAIATPKIATDTVVANQSAHSRAAEQPDAGESGIPGPGASCSRGCARGCARGLATRRATYLVGQRAPRLGSESEATLPRVDILDFV